ncbi:TAXI family TRAP transporter solute-binding subunit [Mameliella sediminis]|uniref:TAXI family TRAP transporter solute-binding subunit n=1 Tax=Mameliella sediminis TaxID=2836866 RepID=UPI001C45088E|nr:TAXI family TRAP transporter solute-binding subunit [Mameliella sediminis]MBV7393445.1 TAXI family TRAP transporter solute-binding subunit [Mameliella sediminis]
MLKQIATAAFLGALTIGAASAETVRAHTTAAGSAPNTVIKLLSRYAGEAGVTVQVAEGQVMTRSMFVVAAGKAEVMSAIVGQYARLQDGTGPFKDMSQQAQEASTHLRSVMSFPVGALHALTWEGNGITSFADVAGKRVYTGPGGGGASVDNEEMIELLTGLKAGKDYEASRMPWREGMQAMRDGQVDVMFRVAPIGSAIIQEFGLSKKIRFLGFTDEDLKDAHFAEHMDVPGRVALKLEPGTYEGQVNTDPVGIGAFLGAIALSDKVSDDTAYKLTKAFWENFDAIRDSAIFLKSVDPQAPFEGLNIPLHPGAIRYYEEAGIAIPDALRP